MQISLLADANQPGRYIADAALPHSYRFIVKEFYSILKKEKKKIDIKRIRQLW